MNVLGEGKTSTPSRHPRETVASTGEGDTMNDGPGDCSWWLASDKCHGHEGHDGEHWTYWAGIRVTFHEGGTGVVHRTLGGR